MSAITRLSEKMKKKISMSEYIEKKPSARKIYSIPKEDMDVLNTIYTKRLNTHRAASVSDILSEAIYLLYSQEG